MMFEGIREHKHILFCADGINALGVARCLGEVGIKPILIEEKGCEGLVRHSKYIAERHQTESWNAAFAFMLEQYGSEEQKPFVYCCDDGAAAFLDSHYDLLKDKFVFDNAGYQGAVCHLQKKEVQFELAKSLGFAIPETEVVKRGEKPTSLRYPVFTKTLDSLMPGWKSEYRIIESEEQFLEEWDSIQSDALLAQEFIEKDNELEIYGFSVDKGNDVFLCPEKRYFRTSKSGFGAYMYYQPSEDAELCNRCRELIKHFGYEGLFDLECLVGQDGKMYFLEVNLRSAMSNYAQMAAGINLPVAWSSAMLNGAIDYTEVNRGRFTAINEIPDFFSSVVHGKENVFHWLNEMRRADVRLLWNRKDFLPAFCGWMQKLKRMIRKAG